MQGVCARSRANPPVAAHRLSAAALHAPAFDGLPRLHGAFGDVEFERARLAGGEKVSQALLDLTRQDGHDGYHERCTIPFAMELVAFLGLLALWGAAQRVWDMNGWLALLGVATLALLSLGVGIIAGHYP